MAKFIAALGLFSLFGSVIATPVDAARPLAATATAVLPNPSQVYINAISYGGTGCPQGSVGTFLSADRQTFVTHLLIIRCRN